MNETWWLNSGQLDPDQKQITGTDPEESLLIVGPPGSGKTNILLLRSNYVRATHPRLIFLTFTRTLAEFLRSGPSVGRGDQIQSHEIMTFMSWGKQVLRDAGAYVPISTNKFNTDRTNLLNALEDYIETQNPGVIYDVIFIDEVQDFLRAELKIIDRLCNKTNSAGDSRQAIWEHREGLPMMEALATKKVELKRHYRIGKTICTFADRILPPPLGAKALVDGCHYDELNRPSSVIPVKGTDIDHQCALCLIEVKKQLRYISDEPILVLAYRREARDAFWTALEQDGELVGRSVLQASEGYETFGPDSLVRVMTIASAKGSEARAVHILDAERLGTSKRELAFTAITRAKTEVILYHSKPLPGHMIPPAVISPEIDACF